MRKNLRSYLDLGFVEEAPEVPRKKEGLGEAPPSARAPMPGQALGGLARAVLWLLGALLLVVLLALTFFAFLPPSAASRGATSRAVERKMAPKASARPPLPHSAPGHLPSASQPAPAPTTEPAPEPTPEPIAVTPRSGSVAVLVGILLGATVALGALSALVALMRKLKNPLYWQLACWMLVVAGIAVRPVVVASSGLPTPGQLLVSIAVGLAVLPGLMRWLNRVSSKPGLEHVAVPFSLGFFLDVSQVIATSFGVKLPWVSS